ncbi:transposase [Leisingera methylohalidivorans]|uniref:transposase n=1 Tax=Leisingera methylohalidivorans TaxID=133924 RepID=UPI000412515A|nr:transposase [Leisingera methylohalidivorans]
MPSCPAHLIPKCPHADLFNKRGRDWLNGQPVPEDERAAIARHIREPARLGADLAQLGRDIAQDALEDEPFRRFLAITGVNPTVASGLMAAIISIARFASPRKLVSYFGLNPRGRQPGLEPAQHSPPNIAGSARPGAAMPARCWPGQPGPWQRHWLRSTPSLSGSGPAAATRTCRTIMHSAALVEFAGGAGRRESR